MLGSRLRVLCAEARAGARHEWTVPYAERIPPMTTLDHRSAQAVDTAPAPEAAPVREFGFNTRALHAGARPDSATGARAVPIYQTTSYVFEERRSCRGPLQPAAVRQYLLADHESHHRRLRGAHRLPGGRRGRGGHRLGPRRAVPGDDHPARPGDQIVSSRTLYGGTLYPVRCHPAPLGHRHRLRRCRRPGELPARDHPAHPRALRRDDRQSRGSMCWISPPSPPSPTRPVCP